MSLVDLCLIAVRDNFKQLYEASREAFVESFRMLPEVHRERLGRSLLKEYSELISLTLIQEVGYIIETTNLANKKTAVHDAAQRAPQS